MINFKLPILTDLTDLTDSADLTDSVDSLAKPLLFEQLFTLTTKYIKKIIVSGQSNVRFNRSEGFIMHVISDSLISCKLNNNILYIETYDKKSYSCCFKYNFLNFFNKNNDDIVNFSKIWKIKAVFIVSDIVVNGYGSVFIDSGFDKTIKCVKNGNGGKIILKNVRVSHFCCDVSGSGRIECINSNCSNLVATASGVGRILTPDVYNMAVLNVKDFAQINCISHEHCKITKKIKKFGNIHIKQIISV